MRCFLCMLLIWWERIVVTRGLGFGCGGFRRWIPRPDERYLVVKGGVPPLPGLTVFGLWSWGSRPRLFDVSLLRSLAGAGGLGD